MGGDASLFLEVRLGHVTCSGQSNVSRWVCHFLVEALSVPYALPSATVGGGFRMVAASASWVPG